MTAKFIIIAPVSAVDACRLVNVISNDPAATAVTIGTEVEAVCPDLADRIITSPIATFEFVTVKVASTPAASEVVSVVIAPHRASIVTPVARLVI